MEEKRSLHSTPDDALLHRLAELVGQSRRVEAELVAHIAEADERRLYAREAFPSMFVYCTNVCTCPRPRPTSALRAERAQRVRFGRTGDETLARRCT